MPNLSEPCHGVRGKGDEGVRAEQVPLGGLSRGEELRGRERSRLRC